MTVKEGLVRRTAVVGAGSWGTTVASLVVGKGQDVVIWARDAAVAEEINNSRTNARFLPGAALPPGLTATADGEEALGGAGVVIWAVPVQFTRARLQACKQLIAAECIFINLSKGFEAETGFRPSQVFHEECPHVSAYGSLGGPNIAGEVAGGRYSEATVAMAQPWQGRSVQELLSSPAFQVKNVPDLTALELAGALKNIVAIAAGIIDGLDGGANLKGLAVSRGFDEMVNLGVAMGSNPFAFRHSFGLADLIATSYSPESRNRRIGEAIGRGRALDDAVALLGGRVAEGIYTARACETLLERLGLSSPLFHAVARVLDGRMALADFVAAALEEPKAVS